MKKYLAEFLIAFFLVFAALGAIAADTQLGNIQIVNSFGPLGIALAAGLALGLAIAAVGRISGGYGNPAVSIALWIARRMQFGQMLGYIVAQLAGGVAASYFLKRVLPGEITDPFGNTALGTGIGPFNGAAIEVILTFFLVFVIWGVAVDRKGPKAIAPFAIGLTVTFDMIIGGPFTGAAMNPARWFGPALAAGVVAKDWYVWVAGPVLGALLASLLYETFFLDEEVADVEVAFFDADEDEIEEEQEAAVVVAVAEPVKLDESWRETPSPYTPPYTPPYSPPAAPPPPPEPPKTETASTWSSSTWSQPPETPTTETEEQKQDPDPSS